MEAHHVDLTQNGEGPMFFVILAVLCLIIFITAYSLTFFRKPTDKNHGH
jgi:hypothetical protein